MGHALYNEIDPQAAAWLRELIARGLIAPGVVDERDIQDISPADLRGFTQVHLFAGIGGWSYALRRAGWPDDRPVWTASCPCQPFSSAGKGAGFDDERHLWPAVDWLVQQCEPECLLGEQVASKDAEPWLDLVQADLEGLGYAFGACAFPSAGIGAPHIRDRTYWVAYRDSQRRYGKPARVRQSSAAGRHTADRPETARGGTPHILAHANRKHERPAGDGARDRELGGRSEAVGVDLAGSTRLEGQRSGHQAAIRQRQGSLRPAAAASQSDRLGDATGGRCGELRHAALTRQGGYADSAIDATGGMADTDGDRAHGITGDAPEAARLSKVERQPEHNANVSERSGADHDRSGFDGGHGLPGHNAGPGPTNGIWGNADWLFCRDGKWRPVEPGTFPLAHGAPSRVGRLRGYGNAINAEAAAAFIASYLEVRAAA